MAKYIRETQSMKAARIEEETAFRDAHPEGTFVYFELEESEPARAAAPAPRPVEEDPQDEDVSDDGNDE